MPSEPTLAPRETKAFCAASLSHWSPQRFAACPALPPITAAQAAPIMPGLDLWDCWPLQHEDGSTATIDGAQYWFFLAAPRFEDPGQRHFHARIRLLKFEHDNWADLGDVLPAESSPGAAEWAGSCVLHEDGRSVTLFFTAAGRRGQGPGFEQRIFASQGVFEAGAGPGGWQAPQHLFAADGAVYMPADQPGGAPGMIKAFRDPAWFRDPADGAVYLLFTGSAGWDHDRFNGLVGHARRTAEGWVTGLPLIHAVGVNNELERPHIVVRGGIYYLFWSTQRHTFSPAATAGPNGLYGAWAERFEGPWLPVNGNGLIATNPVDEPTQAYSWWVTGEGDVWSFIDHWGMRGRSFASHPEVLRGQFGGTPAPRFRLEFSGDEVTLAR